MVKYGIYKAYVKIYKCCNGYRLERNDLLGSRICYKYFPNLDQSASDFQISKFLHVLEKFDLDTFIIPNVTLMIPTDKALENFDDLSTDLVIKTYSYLLVILLLIFILLLVWL